MKKLTDWEVANELVFISDCIAERSYDFKDSHPELFVMLYQIRQKIGDAFKAMGTHEFGIVDSSMELSPKGARRG